MELGPREAHLWYVRSDEVHDPALLAEYHALMTPEEAEKQARFYFPEGRHEYLLTRALVRSTLSRYAAVDPRDWTFERNEHGCPSVSGPAGAPRLSFNLSNTRGMIACIVALEHDVGVDVEETQRATDAIGIADRFFSAFEVEALHALPAERQRERFFQYWTLKESYIKARKMGLAIPLEQFSFHLDEGAEIGISFDPRLGDDPGGWQFGMFRPSGRHAMACAVRHLGSGPFRVVVRETVPLRG
ncbi:MAG: 4'-phosphopantetheinyl transferase superfamily protein [Polyangiaceae bacterium]|nr:4'-phosphopantetheinyl transferase superfamily protein [Polyangiaceae bacterium]